jgi:predicted MFS family arabinose efflux permease
MAVRVPGNTQGPIEGRDGAQTTLLEQSLQRKATSDVGDMSRIWDFVRLLRRRSNVILYVQGILGCLPWGVVGVFLNDYLLVDRKAPSKFGAFVVCAAFGLGTVLGQILGGQFGRKLYMRDVNLVIYMLVAAQLLAVPPMLLLLNLEFDFKTLIPIAFVGGAFAMICAPNVKALLLNVNSPDTRGSATAVFSLCDDIGKGLGPPIIAALAGIHGRRVAFSMAACMWAVQVCLQK